MVPLVSILIPAYNAGQWLEETISSAVGQTWNNKEIIIVDDGSTDKSFEIARTSASESVTAVRQDHAGAAAARNRAFTLSRGEYIQWLDADDLLAPDKIAEQMKAVSTDRPDLNLYSSPHGTFYYRHWKAKFVPNALWRDLSPRDWLVENFSNNLWIQPAAWLVSRALTERAGPWDERLSMDDDGEYFARIVANSGKVKFVPEPKSYYRQTSFRQVSRNLSDQALASLLLSVSQRILTLLGLEDSARTRKACLGLLQDIFPYFYPEKATFIGHVNDLASGLGGRLDPPNFGWRSSFLQRCLGPHHGKELMADLRKLKMFAAVHWDKMLYKLNF